jgi:hypothetical protein
MEINAAFPVRALSKKAVLIIAALTVLMLAGGAVAASGEIKQARAADAVELTYTKWFFPHFPTSVGVVAGDFTGTMAGQVLSRRSVADNQIVLFTARYDVSAGADSFSALIEGEQNNEIHSGVVNGEVTAGALTGRQVHETYDVVSCTQAPTGFCFQGNIRIT